MVDGVRKILFKFIIKKEFIIVDIMKKLYDYYGVLFDLFDFRIYCMFSLVFVGFLRFKEFVNICFVDLIFFDLYV